MPDSDIPQCTCLVPTNSGHRLGQFIIYHCIIIIQIYRWITVLHISHTCWILDPSFYCFLVDWQREAGDHWLQRICSHLFLYKLPSKCLFQCQVFSQKSGHKGNCKYNLLQIIIEYIGSWRKSFLLYHLCHSIGNKTNPCLSTVTCNMQK